MNKKKVMGQVFTPQYVAEFILNEVGYKNGILGKKVMEPSAGDGVFIVSIIRRAFNELKQKESLNKKNVTDLLNDIFAIELDEIQYKILIRNATNEILNHIGRKEEIIRNSELEKILIKNITCQDTLKKIFNFKFDFIVGNPPYVRLHNLEKENLDFLRASYDTMKSGSVDLYYAFFEWSLNNLSEEGKVSLITPNNFLNNSSGIILRNILKGKIQKLYNFQSIQIFENASTYNSIIIFGKKEIKNPKGFFPEIVNNIIKPGKEKNLIEFRNKIIIADKKWIENFAVSSKPKLNFKNGLATLADDIFITSTFNKDKDFYYFNGYKIEKEMIKKIVKISTNFSDEKEKIAIFPYKIVKGKVIGLTEEELLEYPNAYQYFRENRKRLESRSLDSNAAWFHYGRSQAITSILSNKIILKNLVKENIEFAVVPKNVLVYSGLFSETEMNDEIKTFLESDDLVKYIKQTGFDKRGGYKTITSNILKELWSGDKNEN